MSQVQKSKKNNQQDPGHCERMKHLINKSAKFVSYDEKREIY